ncbi:MAG: DsrE family protein, partial [Synergistaceae bacterium]|nr:DsrE family protein [Synergistaceae bacterium]
MEHSAGKKLVVLWTSGEKETAMSMVMLYSLNSKLKGWWDEVTLLVWGAST